MKLYGESEIKQKRTNHCELLYNLYTNRKCR